MKFLRHIKSRSKVKDDFVQAKLYQNNIPPPPRSYGPDRTSKLPPKVLRKIFENVCPQTCDESYTSLEETAYDGCLLCDVRDLAACSQVSKRWQGIAQEMLYKHVQIDSVHYCDLEFELSEKRKNKSVFNRNAVPPDPPKVRLQLLMRTVRENKHLASVVESFRLPYMTREACKADLARTVSVLYNLRYVDLPEGFFTDDPSTNALKQELQVSCPEIRRMRYGAGSERSFVNVAKHRYWQSMEILELVGIHVEPQDLIFVLASFPVLQEVKLVDLPWLEDSIFRPENGAPSFPPVQRLTFSDTPQVHAAGLATYLSFPQNREALTELNLSKTGIQPQHLYLLLAKAPRLENVTITEDVERALPTDPPVPALTSNSLKTLHFEITAHHSARHHLHPPSASYYGYLASSLLSNSLPSLVELYVRDPLFPETLLLPLPTARRPFSNYSASGQSPPTSPGFAPRSLKQPLSIYSKGEDDLEWNFTAVAPPSPVTSGHRRTGSGARPISIMGADSLSPAWGASARKSVIVGNGMGGFLAVPTEEMPKRPSSSSSNRSFGTSTSGSGGRTSWAGGQAGSSERMKKERKDLWR